MASTNKTSNYDLSQFIGSDKPAWLGDYNSDMEKIDTAIKETSDKAISAKETGDLAKETANTAISNIQSINNQIDEITSTASSANENASTALTTANEAKSSITTLETTVATAQSTADNASSVANQNKSSITSINSSINSINSSITSLENKFEFTNFTTKETATLQQDLNGKLTLARNADGSVFKLYGTFFVKKSSEISITLTSIPGVSGKYGLATGLYVTSEQTGINIDGVNNMVFTSNGADFSYMLTSQFAIGSNGQIYLFSNDTNTKRFYANDISTFYFPPCVYFNTNFND